MATVTNADQQAVRLVGLKTVHPDVQDNVLCAFGAHVRGAKPFPGFQVIDIQERWTIAEAAQGGAQ